MIMPRWQTNCKLKLKFQFSLVSVMRIFVKAAFMHYFSKYRIICYRSKVVENKSKLVIVVP